MYEKHEKNARNRQEIPLHYETYTPTAISKT